MSFDPIENAMEQQYEQEYSARAAICRKHAERFWDETAEGKAPNLALIINDAIADGIELYVKHRQ